MNENTKLHKHLDKEFKKNRTLNLTNQISLRKPHNESYESNKFKKNRTMNLTNF
jgi:hypothetical protein